MSIIQKIFAGKSFTIPKITKPMGIINEVSPNLYENLQNSTKEFLKGVIDKDVQYIKQLSAVALGNKLAEELQQNVNTDFNQKFNLSNYNFDVPVAFQIAPYVIFGQDFKTKIDRKQPFQNIKPITSNRFYKQQPGMGLLDNFRSYRDKQIYGFNCFYSPQISQSASEQFKKDKKTFNVTFQTDSQNIDFFVVDCQGYLLEKYVRSRYNIKQI